MKPGLVVCSQYSGMRCLEQAVDMSLKYFAKEGHSSLAPDQCLHYYSACDVDVLAQSAMLSCPDEVKAEHNFTDIELRMAAEFLEEVKILDPGLPAVSSQCHSRDLWGLCEIGHAWIALQVIL